jgi:hypothetical protein
MKHLLIDGTQRTQRSAKDAEKNEEEVARMQRSDVLSGVLSLPKGLSKGGIRGCRYYETRAALVCSPSPREATAWMQEVEQRLEQLSRVGGRVSVRHGYLVAPPSQRSELPD